jgi:hypothetical protein
VPKRPADEIDLHATRRFLQECGLNHLHVRKRAEVLTIASGTEADPWPRARLRRDTVHLWLLDIANHRGKWEHTGFRDTRENLLKLLVSVLGWVLVDHPA